MLSGITLPLSFCFLARPVSGFGSRCRSVGRSGSSSGAGFAGALRVVGFGAVPPLLLFVVLLSLFAVVLSSSAPARTARCGASSSPPSTTEGCTTEAVSVLFFGDAGTANRPYPYHAPTRLSSATELRETTSRAYSTSNSPRLWPARSIEYSSPVSSVNGTGRARYRSPSSKWLLMKRVNGINRAESGFFSSPVHS